MDDKSRKNRTSSTGSSSHVNRDTEGIDRSSESEPNRRPSGDFSNSTGKNSGSTRGDVSRDRSGLDSDLDEESSIDNERSERSDRDI